MLRKIFTGAFVCMFLFQSFAAKRSRQELIPAGHWVYDELEEICVEAGIVNFADSAPLSIQELSLYMSEIDYSSLSTFSRAKYDRITQYFSENSISFDSDILSVGFEPSVNISAFYKDNDEIDWVFDRYERKPFIDVPVTISGGDWFSMNMDVCLGQNKGVSLHNDNYINVPFSADDMDINFPDTGYFSTGVMLTEKTGVGFHLGKGSRNIGRSLTGSMIWSEYLTGVSYAQIEAYAPDFKYTGHVSQFNVDRYMYTHQIEARLFKKFTFTALEGMFVNAPLELRFLNPWTIFHGMAPWREYEPDKSDPESHTCAYLGLKFQFVPVKNLKFYGNYAQTQYQTSYEMDNWPDNTTPNGIGYQLGTQFYIPLSKGRLKISAEGSWADPYLYVKESPNWTLVRTYDENIGDKAVFYEWIGSPFGPDTTSGEFTVGYEVPGKFSLDLVYLYMARGEYSGNRLFTKELDWGGVDMTEDPDFWAYPDSDVWGYNTAKIMQAFKGPHGIIEHVNRISLRATCNYKNFVNLIIQPSYVIIINRNNVHGNSQNGFEFALACEINLSRLVK